LYIAGEFVAQFKFTLLLMPNGPMKITGLSFDESLYESENSVTDEEMKVTVCTVCWKFQHLIHVFSLLGVCKTLWKYHISVF